MAVSLIATIQRFQGLAADTKPTAPPEGSTYHAVDTGEEYVYYDGTWVQDLRLIAAMRAV